MVSSVERNLYLENNYVSIVLLKLGDMQVQFSHQVVEIFLYIHISHWLCRL